MAKWDVFQNSQKIISKYYIDFGHSPSKVSSYNAGDVFEIQVQYYWVGSPHPDYTVKVYSKHSGVQLLNSA